MPLPCPPSNDSPSIVPTKSTVTRSPSAAPRSTGTHVARWLRSFSIMASRSGSSTSTLGTSIASSPSSFRVISG
jgi:hypothetical protein